MPEVRATSEGGGHLDFKRGVLVFFALVAVLAGLWLTDPDTRRIEVNVAGAAVAFTAAWACGRRSRSGALEEQGAWRWVSLAMVLQGLGHGVLILGLAETATLPFLPRLQDLLFLAVLPALFAALLLWPHEHRSPGRRRRTFLDAFIFGGSLLFIFWQLGLRDLARDAPDALALLSILPFVLVCLDLGYWAYLVLPASNLPQGPLGFLGLTLVGACGVNLAAMVATLSGSYAPGHWSDALTILVLVFPALAAWSPQKAALVLPTGAPEECPGRLELLLPFLPAVAGWMVVMVQILVARERLDWQSTALAAFVVGALFLRQFLSMWDLEGLSRSLESKIQARTLELGQAQDVIVRTERLNAMATLGAGLAHDIKNLIGVVRNYALLVHRDLQEGRPAEMEDLESIQLASGQAVELANQLMNYGRSDTNAEECFDLNQRLKQLAIMLQAALPAGITLRVELSEEPMALRENPFHLDQVVVNLVLNARDALPEGGLIELSLMPDRLESGQRAARLEVRDNGVGMSEDVKARLFEPFFSTKPPGQATGIGLASVKAALRGFGGRISLESELGHGSRFLILLPLA